MSADYIITDHTGAHWPGRLPYRSPHSDRGYSTYEDAMARLDRVVQHYNALHGCAPGDLRIYRRLAGRLQITDQSRA